MTEPGKPGALTQDPPAKEEKHLEEARKSQDKIDADNPRFKEVYGKMKAHERALEEKDKDIEALRDHTEQLASQLKKLQEGKEDRKPEPEPDRELEPEAHKKWKEIQDLKKQKAADDKEIERHLHMQIEVQREIHEDYQDAVKLAECDMKKDKELAKKIWGSDNPAKAAYKHGKAILGEKQKVETDEKERQERLKKGDVLRDGGEEGDDKDEVKLTDAQKRVIRNLYPDIPYAEASGRYIKSMKITGGI